MFQTDKSGTPVVSKANPETGRRIADATDGASVPESDAYEGFEKSITGVSSADGTEDRSEGTPVSPFHVLSLLALVAAFAIPDKMSA